MQEKYYKLSILLITTIFLAGCTTKIQNSNLPTKPIPSPTQVQTTTETSFVERFASPDKNYETLSIITEKSQIYKDKQVNFIPGSNNIWLFNSKSQEYTQITEHLDNVARDNIYWTKDNNLIFTEGESNVSKFDPKTLKKKTILGKLSPQGKCVDTCGYQSDFITSPLKKYYIKIISGINSNNTPIEWVNIETEKTGKIDGQYSIDAEAIIFKSENQFTVSAKIIKESAVYGDLIVGKTKNLQVTME